MNGLDGLIGRTLEMWNERKRMEQMLDMQTFMLDKQFLYGPNADGMFGVPEPLDAPSDPGGPPLFPEL